MSKTKVAAPPEVTTAETTSPPQASPTSPESQTPGLKRSLGILLILAITAFSIWLALNPAIVQQFGNWGYVGAFIISLIASATIVLPAPGLAIIIAMGGALDPVLLGIVAGVGSAFGELSGYVAGATGSTLIPEEQRHHFDRLHQLTDKYGGWLLLVLSAIPFPLFDLAGMVAGALRLNIPIFLLSVAVGKSVKYIVLILLAAGSLQWLQAFFN